LQLKDCLQELSNARGVSGNEGEAQEIIEKYLKQHVHEVKKDVLGNLVGYKKGGGRSRNKPRLFFAAHADEIGLMVTRVEEEGFLRFTTIGGFDPRTLWGQEVTVHGKNRLWGVIGPRPPHLTTTRERKKETRLEHLFIDTGLPPEEVKNSVNTGDHVSINRDFTQMANRRYASGKALDNRAGVAALLLFAEELARFKHVSEVYFVFTAQEEVGARGALTSTCSVEPDLGIAVDVCHGNMPRTRQDETFELGKGPVLGHGPNIHPYIFKRLQNTAEENRLPYMTEPHAGPTPTDARSIQITGEGVASGLVSLPLRYMHTSVEVVNLDDLEVMAKLLSLFTASVDKKTVEELRCYY